MPSAIRPVAKVAARVTVAMYRKITHFANLTSLRFVAAYLVVIFHIEETRKMFGLPNLTRFSLFDQGPAAVTFFFVLSGYLITYLLLREHEETGRVNVPRFYVRRILRIWPLYFLMVFIGLVLIPAGIKLGRVRYEAPFHSLEVAPYFLFFASFCVNLIYGNHFLTPLWSIGIEEIYYFTWAPILRWLRKHVLAVMLGTIAIKFGLTAWAHYGLQTETTKELLRMLQFESMAMGGLAAYFLFHRSQPLHLHWLFSKPAQSLLLVLLLVRLFFHHWATQTSTLYAALLDHQVFSPLLLMAVFAWCITNISANERRIIGLESRVLSSLGSISYGIYVYHALAISLIFVPFVRKYQAASFLYVTLMLHALIPALTMLLAAISKRLYEDRFLSYKLRFQAISENWPDNRGAAQSGDASRPRMAA